MAWAGVAVAAAIAGVLLAWIPHRAARRSASTVSNSSNAIATADETLPSAEVAHALMVTVDLDFGGRMPSIKEALTEVERRHQPDDGRGRTFAILDAYGEPTPAGRLHMSMHLSMEKPGIGSLLFRRTGEVLWKSRIVQGKSAPSSEKNLTVMLDDGQGKTFMLDGSKGAMHVLDVPLRNSSALTRDFWPDGAERELTFVYSACGCPVKAKVRRTGEMTARTTDLPVMFPDDPAALAVIQQLMGWPVEH
jgi:hypothetical protein